MSVEWLLEKTFVIPIHFVFVMAAYYFPIWYVRYNRRNEDISVTKSDKLFGYAGLFIPTILLGILFYSVNSFFLPYLIIILIVSPLGLAEAYRRDSVLTVEDREKIRKEIRDTPDSDPFMGQ